MQTGSLIRRLKIFFKRLNPRLERVVLRLDRAVSNFAQPRRARKELMILAYCGWGSPQRTEVSGRVVYPRTMAPPMTSDPRWRNFTNILRRFLSREVGGIRVSGTLGGQTVQAVSDHDGYFTLVFGEQAQASADASTSSEVGSAPWQLPSGWHSAELRIAGRERVTHARVRVADQAAYGIISDLDDTVLKSDVTSIPSMMRTVLTSNARTRSPFPGVGSLYRALTHGGAGRNPVFYVSSSPWNLYDLLWQFLEFRRIPLGPLFLRNWGAELLAPGGNSHGGHKHSVIDRILRAFPHLPFVLVGDSGEQDPEIYSEVVRKYPGRVLAIYIRDVAGGRRDEGVRKLRIALAGTGVDLVLTQDSYAAAAHAMAMGLITPDALRGVRDSVERALMREYGVGWQ